MKLSNRVFNLMAATACVFAICQPAHGYIDAGSGSYLLQILFAGILGGAFAAKSAFGNLKLMVSRRMHAGKGKDSASHVG